MKNIIPTVPRCSQTHPHQKGSGRHSALPTVLNRSNTVLNPTPSRSQDFLLGAGTGDGYIYASFQLTDAQQSFPVKLNKWSVVPAVPDHSQIALINIKETFK